jgi:S-adenosylmethionine:diacylglycerol 3-amino-3-carboxypropyl transferase
MIFYSHVNEDNEVERAAMTSASYRQLFCVAGSGERVIALLGHPGLQQIYAVDPNPEALYLLELKLVALETLGVENYLAFCGFSENTARQRAAWFESLKPALSERCASFWENNQPAIAAGICHCGHFESFLARVRPLANRFLGKKFRAAFCRDFTTIEGFPHIRWYILKRLFAQKQAYRLMGNRDDAFVGEGCTVNRIPQGLQTLLDENRLGKSFMAHLIFKGHLRDMHPLDLPPSLQPDLLLKVHKALREKAFHIEYHCEGMLEFLEKRPAEKTEAVFCSFSDVMSFEPPKYLLDCLRIFRDRFGKTTLVARTFLKNELPSSFPEQVRALGFSMSDVSGAERTAMYHAYKIGN